MQFDDILAFTIQKIDDHCLFWVKRFKYRTQWHPIVSKYSIAIYS